jgi:zinc protease
MTFAQSILSIDWAAARLPSRLERLANGLTVITHFEPRAPVAAVYVGYRVGSRDEPHGKAGLAHLCEHLMFCGTKAAPGSYFTPLEQAGAAWVNAFVKEDYSAYFATVPTSALDLALSLEADRMANLADALTDQKIDVQRQVVANELRQREQAPFGCAEQKTAEMMHPPAHPYSHPADGLTSELDNASAGDIREWASSHHIPGNAVVIIAGAIEPREATELARLHFQKIPERRPRPRSSALLGESRTAERFQLEQAATPGICFGWIGPVFDSPDYPVWQLAFEILAGASTSRLRSDVREFASDVALALSPRELGSLAVVSITARRLVALDLIETSVRRAIEQFALEGPSQNELDIARLRLVGGLLRSFERVGGRPSKSDALGLATLVGGTPQLHDQHLWRLLGTDRTEITATAHRWISVVGGVLEILPRRNYKG